MKESREEKKKKTKRIQKSIETNSNRRLIASVGVVGLLNPKSRRKPYLFFAFF